jgi:hypothetical protein
MRMHQLALAVLAISVTLVCGGCSWMGGREKTYAVSTATGEVVVTCEFFSHDGGYWEPTTEEAYPFQWVCDAIPDYWAFGWPPQTVTNPSDPSEIARRR